MILMKTVYVLASLDQRVQLFIVSASILGPILLLGLVLLLKRIENNNPDKIRWR